MGDEIEDVAHRRRAWTKAREGAFLDHLAATCNVMAACRAANVRVRTAYYRRRTDPVFAVAWRAALLTGYDVLEARLLARAGAATDQALQGDFDVDLAMRLLASHSARMKAQDAGTARPQNRVRRATPEETDDAILKQLAALDRRMKTKAAR